MFDSVFNKGTSKKPLLFDIILRLNQVHMRVKLILHVIHIAGNRIIETGIDGLSRGNNFGCMMRGMNTLQFVTFDK